MLVTTAPDLFRQSKVMPKRKRAVESRTPSNMEAPEPPSKKRGGPRKSVPRPRTGCKTCKRRHVKCDEAEPECQNCLQTGRKCDGYVEETPKRAGSKLSALASTLSISSYEIPFKIPGSQNDRRILHYYCVHASNDLAGPSKSDFWTRLVLQCSQDDPVVRSALLALSYEHLDFMTRDYGQYQRQASTSLEGLQQHHKAVRQLRRYLQTTTTKEISIKAVLVCCILFYHFECSRDDLNTALVHLRMGLAILRNPQDPEASPLSNHTFLGDPDMQVLVRTLSRLDTNASRLDTQRPPELNLLTEDVLASMRLNTSPFGDTLQNVQEAESALTILQNWAVRLILAALPYQRADVSQVPQSLVAERSELLLRFKRWSDAVDVLEATAGTEPNSPIDQDAQMFISEQRLGAYSAIVHLQRILPFNPTVLTGESEVTSNTYRELVKLVPYLANGPGPSMASILGGGTRAGSRAPSPTMEDTQPPEDDTERSGRRHSSAHLQPPPAGYSRSPSPSPLRESIPTSRSFCAQGNTVTALFVLAAKTSVPSFRDQLMALLAQISERREGPWSAAIAFDVLSRLRDLSNRTRHRSLSGLDQTAIFGQGYQQFNESAEHSPSDDGRPQGRDEFSEGSEAEDNSEVSRSSSPPRTRSDLAHLGLGEYALSQRAREYAAHMMNGRPFCVVAACMRRGFHADRCLWCDDRQEASSPLLLGGTEEPSLEDVGAKMIGGFSGFERFLQERGRRLSPLQRRHQGSPAMEGSIRRAATG